MFSNSLLANFTSVKVKDRFHHKALELPAKSMHVGPFRCSKCSKKAGGKPTFQMHYKLVDKEFGRIMYACMKCHIINKVKRLYETVGDKIVKQKGREWRGFE